jgi:hypothetical protein
VDRPTFVFETTTAALWGEEVAGARGIPAELVPAPAEARAKCDLALVTLPERVDELAAALDEERVPARRWS